MFKNLLEKDIEKYGNNLGIDIPKLLAEKYPNWIYNTPEILQLDENFEPVKPQKFGKRSMQIGRLKA